jgi:hypothetical protein
VHILRPIIKAAGYLMQSQTKTLKTLLFVVKDCDSQANHSVLSTEIEKIVDMIIDETPGPKSIKFNLEFYFMSHFIYHKEKYMQEAAGLPPTIKIKKPRLAEYEPKDRVAYLRHLWSVIIANEG